MVPHCARWYYGDSCGRDTRHPNYRHGWYDGKNDGSEICCLGYRDFRQTNRSYEEGFSVKQSVRVETAEKQNSVKKKIVENANTPEWEKGMTEEDHQKVKEREEELKRERIRESRKRKSLGRVNRFISPWFPNTFTQPIHEYFFEESDKRKYDDTTFAAAILTIQLIVYVVLVYLVGTVCHLFSLFIHLSLYWFTGSMTGLGFAVYWIVNKTIKIITRPKERTYQDELRYSYDKKSYSLQGYDTYISIAVLLGVSYLVHYSDYAPVLASTWVPIVIIILAKAVPGVGGNSSLGTAMIVFVALLAYVTVPDVWRILLKTTKEVLEAPPSSPTIKEPVLQYAETITWNLTTWLSVGYAPDNLWDIIRMIASLTPQLWVAIDDLVGPGVAITKATELKTRNDKATQKGGWAAIYSGTWWMTIAAQLFMAWYAGNMYTLMIIVLSTISTWTIWNLIGRKEWIGRGQGVTMTDVRAGYRMIFGQGPEGLRILILRICTMIAWVCLVIRNRNSFTAIMCVGLAYTTHSEKNTAIMLGIATKDPIWLMIGIWNKKPVTQSLLDNAVDAYTPGERNENG
nr:VP3 [Trichopteran jingmen-related virus]